VTAIISIDVAEIDALLARVEPLIPKADHERLSSIASTLIEVTRQLRQRGATIARLRRMLGQTSNEKTANVVGANAAVSTSAAGAEAASEPDKSADPPANDTGDATKDGDKPKRKGHGRIPGSAYTSESVAVPHPTLCAGQPCPACAHGALYGLKVPASTVRVFGQAPLVALRWDCDGLRCSGCGHVFTAPLPEEARGPKYSESAASMMIVLRPWNYETTLARLGQPPARAA